MKEPSAGVCFGLLWFFLKKWWARLVYRVVRKKQAAHPASCKMRSSFSITAVVLRSSIKSRQD